MGNFRMITSKIYQIYLFVRINKKMQSIHVRQFDSVKQVSDRVFGVDQY